MTKSTLAANFLVLIIVASACTATTTPSQPGPILASSQAVNSADAQSSDLGPQLSRIAAEAKGRVGVAARVLESGETVELNADEHYPMHSVYKLPIAMAVLRRVGDGEMKLEDFIKVKKSDLVPASLYSPIRDRNPNGATFSIAQLLGYAVTISDGTASDVLLKEVGGGQVVMQFLKSINVNGINVVNSEREISRDWQTQYENWAKPRGAVDLLAALQASHGIASDSRELLLGLLTASVPGAKRLKGELPAGTVVAHKTGTGGTRNGITSATNDIGIITLPDGRHLAVAVFVSDSKADLATREAVIAKIAKACWDKWVAHR